ncbi:16282_t:CDS:2 [Funneliformis caledonium]|uniref:16282_t:CDS:1 n=1 Tax=Funneliformis caledonium TaxID=1117310 RepID=A0A9N9N2Y8_9GLOM|nr:16282_t:CDS:2 [Funneliformis caledonium]
MADIEEIINLYVQIPTFHLDFKPILDKMPPSLVKRAFDQLLNMRLDPVAKLRKYFVYSIDIRTQTENSDYLDKAIQTDKTIQTEYINFLKQIKEAKLLLTNTIIILSNI